MYNFLDRDFVFLWIISDLHKTIKMEDQKINRQNNKGRAVDGNLLSGNKMDVERQTLRTRTAERDDSLFGEI